MTKKERRALLDSKIVGIDTRSMHRNRLSECRSRLSRALEGLPSWADDVRWFVDDGRRGRLQCRHEVSGCWVSINKHRYTQAVVQNLNLGLWTKVVEGHHTMEYTCRHGNTYSRKFRNCNPPKSGVLLGQCPKCLTAAREPVFGTLTRKQRKWEQGLSDPNNPCIFYVHVLSDGSYIYGVSVKPRLQHRMDQYKASMGYEPEVLYQTEGTERHMWYAEEVIKKGITRGLDHDCEARYVEGGRTEYLPETYAVSQVIELIEEAIEITAELALFVRP